MNKYVVMGLNTLLSFPGGKPLKNRINIVLSDKDIPEQEGLVICRSIEALAAEIEVNAADYVKVAALMAEQEETQHKLDEATERWLFLQEKWEQIQAQKNG